VLHSVCPVFSGGLSRYSAACPVFRGGVSMLEKLLNLGLVAGLVVSSPASVNEIPGQTRVILGQDRSTTVDRDWSVKNVAG